MVYKINNETFKFITLNESVENATVFKHFKNKYYKIFAIGKDSESGTDVVIYQQMYGNHEFYVRPALMFFSDVDHIKYPDVEQKKRFEICINNPDIKII